MNTFYLACDGHKIAEHDYHNSGPLSGSLISRCALNGAQAESVSSLLRALELMNDLEHGPEYWTVTRRGRQPNEIFVTYCRYENDNDEAAQEDDFKAWETGEREYLWLSSFRWRIVKTGARLPFDDDDLSIEGVNIE